MFSKKLFLLVGLFCLSFPQISNAQGAAPVCTIDSPALNTNFLDSANILTNGKGGLNGDTYKIVLVKMEPSVAEAASIPGQFANLVWDDNFLPPQPGGKWATKAGAVGTKTKYELWLYRLNPLTSVWDFCQDRKITIEKT